MLHTCKYKLIFIERKLFYYTTDEITNIISLMLMLMCDNNINR